MFSLTTSKAKSTKFKSTRTCFFCGGTGFRHNGYKAYECMECKDGGMAVELDIDRLIEFLNNEIKNNENSLNDEELALDDDLRSSLYYQKSAYEHLLSIILSNSLS
jgi:hypothetical protein